MLPLHLGPLHPVEQGLTFALAFGPFVVLGVVVVVLRRREAQHEPESEASPPTVIDSEPPEPADPGGSAPEDRET